MKQFKGTEGRWKVIEGKSSGKQVISESAPKIRMNVASCGGQKRDENANLIAAAPELLEALQRMTKLYESLMTDCGLSHKDLIDSSHAAINKALGVKND